MLGGGLQLLAAWYRDDKYSENQDYHQCHDHDHDHACLNISLKKLCLELSHSEADGEV